MSLHHLVKFRTIIVTSLLQKYYNKCFNEEIRRQTKTAKLTNLLFCFLYNIFFLCYFYSLSLHCFKQSLYCFWGKKWVALKRAGCWVAVKEPVIVIDLDLHYKHEAVSEKISKSYNFGCIVTAGISFIK